MEAPDEETYDLTLTLTEYVTLGLIICFMIPVLALAFPFVLFGVMKVKGRDDTSNNLL